LSDRRAETGRAENRNYEVLVSGGRQVDRRSALYLLARNLDRYKLSSDDIVFSTQLNKLYANGEISATSADFRSKRQQLRKKA